MTKFGNNSRNQLFSKYKRDARRRDIIFGLNRPHFFRLTSANCHYCGEEPKTIFKNHKNRKSFYIYNGIDRKDNEVGYIRGNVVSACKTCNYLKGTLTKGEFLDIVGKIYRYKMHKCPHKDKIKITINVKGFKKVKCLDCGEVLKEKKEN
mgnify:CR=1 FL=1